MLPGTFEEVLILAKAEGKVVAIPSTFNCRVLSGLSHLVATRMVGSPELFKAAERVFSQEAVFSLWK